MELAGNIANLDLVFLFFFLGMFASWVRSDLEFPESASRFLSIFLLLSLGLKGGHEVRSAESLGGFTLAATLGIGSCVLIPLYLFYLLRKKMGQADAAGLAASYGSVSAVTFVAAYGTLVNMGIEVNGYMVAVMALMEIPAIVVALALHERYRKRESAAMSGRIFSAKSVVLLLGGFAIGLLLDEKGWGGIKPVVQDSFKGVLAFFLLDLGVQAQKQMRKAWQHKAGALLVGTALPLVHGTAAILLASFLGLSRGDQVLVAVLAGSASYIAAPAAIRANIPAANPGLYVALPLGLTFPMNIVLGIPLYLWISG